MNNLHNPFGASNTYATIEAMIARFGKEDLIEVTDTEKPFTGEINQVKLGEAIASANAEVDAYLSKVLNVPTVIGSKFVQMMACDIARYHVALGNSRVSERDEKRYGLAVKNLQKVNDGDIGTGASTQAEQAQGSKNMAVMTSGRPDGGHVFGSLNW